MKFEGRVWKFGDHVDTDVIIPARFLNVSDKNELAKHCFMDTRPDFPREVQSGDMIVAGVNFGCGSSREHAPWAIKACGISVVIARSFARIFYRNAFNIGLPILECDEAVEAFSDGEHIAVDIGNGEIQGFSRGPLFFAKPIPPFMQEIIRAGGLVNHIKNQRER